MTDPHYTHTEKTCIHCKERKLESLFPPGRNTCKSCRNKMKIAARKAREARDPKSRERRLESGRRYVAKNREKVAKRKAEWIEKNRERTAEYQRMYYLENQDAIRERTRRWGKDNPGRRLEYNRRWVEKNPEKYAECNRRKKQKRMACPVRSEIERTRSLVSRSFRKHGYQKDSKTQYILGCDWEFFRQHIERQFLKGMSWDNRSQWHIDHIIPLATATSKEDVHRLNHYTNLRPLWAWDNLSKGAEVQTLI